MRILRAADYRVMPWKNGGGTTTEIAVSPERAGLDDFDWRVSMARVERDGPFSSFPGIDRTLSILEGEGIDLGIAGRQPIRLDRASDPLFFPADVPTHADLLSGPITDLNVMARRSRIGHSVERLRISGATDIAAEAETTLIFCHEGKVRAGSADGMTLGPLDTLCVRSAPSLIRLSTEETATVFVIRMRPSGQND